MPYRMDKDQPRSLPELLPLLRSAERVPPGDSVSRTRRRTARLRPRTVALRLRPRAPERERPHETGSRKPATWRLPSSTLRRLGSDPRMSIRARGGSCAAINEAGHTTGPERMHRTTEDLHSERACLAPGQPRLSTAVNPLLGAGAAPRSFGYQPRPTVQEPLEGQPGGWPSFHENYRGAGGRSVVAVNHRSRLCCKTKKLRKACIFFRRRPHTMSSGPPNLL